jgi:O-antigen/teichoic acid export membrane protein
MLRTLLASAILGIVFFLAQYFHFDSFLHPYIWYILIFFFGLSFFAHRLMEFGLRNNREKFVTFYISTIVGRIVLSLVFIALFLYQGLTDSFLFVTNFFALYLFYTCFEIYGLYRNLRRD